MLSFAGIVPQRRSVTEMSESVETEVAVLRSRWNAGTEVSTVPTTTRSDIRSNSSNPGTTSPSISPIEMTPKGHGFRLAPVRRAASCAVPKVAPASNTVRIGLMLLIAARIQYSGCGNRVIGLNPSSLHYKKLSAE